MTTIRYFIPEDGDEEMYPNVFLAAKSRHPGVPPSLSQIRDAFPLPGRYHFRFKSPLVPGGDRDKDAMAVWLDCVEENKPVPTWRNSIITKVTRTGVEDEDEDDEDFVSGGATTRPTSVPQSHSAPPPRTASVSPVPPPQPTQSQPARSASHQQPSLDIFDQPSSAPPAAAAAQTGNLLDGHHHAPAPASSGGGGLLDMDAPVYGNHGSSNNAHSDFLGMTAPVAQAPRSGGYNATGGIPQAPRSGGYNPTGSIPQAPRSGGYNPSMMNAYGQQQQQQQQQNNAFSNFSDKQGPFGDLAWK